jgi:hypothetical protein
MPRSYPAAPNFGLRARRRLSNTTKNASAINPNKAATATAKVAGASSGPLWAAPMDPAGSPPATVVPVAPAAAGAAAGAAASVAVVDSAGADGADDSSDPADEIPSSAADGDGPGAVGTAAGRGLGVGVGGVGGGTTTILAVAELPLNPPPPRVPTTEAVRVPEADDSTVT